MHTPVHPRQFTLRNAVLLLLLVSTLLVLFASSATAQGIDPALVPDRIAPVNPATSLAANVPSSPTLGDDTGVAFELDLGDAVQEPSQSLVVILLLTVMALAPSLLIMLTSFTRIVIVLSVTRNAIGLPSVPPTQVVVGLALFLSIFTMTPTFTEINETALQPLLNQEMETTEALELAQKPIRTFMMGQVGEEELAMFVDASGDVRPDTPEDIPMTTLIPAFILSELKAAFIIAFVIFVPFLIVDLITASTLMSMGMMMLPPVLVSLPFKLLLFVLVDGWTLVIRSLLESFAT